MRIGDTLRKAAGLLIEFDEPDPATEFYRTASSNLRAAPSVPVAAPTPAQVPAPAPANPTPEPSTSAAAPVATRTVEQVVRDSPGPNLDQITAPAMMAADVISPDGSVDFAGIYRLATLPTSAFCAEQVLDLLASLPAELPLETKRATVKVTLNAMTQSLGVSSDTIVADASRKLAALADYAQSYAHQADDYISKSEAEIAALEQEMTRRKQSIAETKAKQAKVHDACHAESDRLDDVLEFFTLDVAPSKYAVPST
jgi:hypothetical protein